MTLDELKKLDDQMVEMEGRMKAMGVKQRELHHKLAGDEAKNMYKESKKFVNLFTDGVVIDGFNKIMQHMENLKQHDPNYIAVLGGDRYGIKGGPETAYLAEIFGGVWKLDATLWNVMEHVSRTINVVGNPFNEKGV